MSKIEEDLLFLLNFTILNFTGELPMSKVLSGLDHLKLYNNRHFPEKMALLCHAASVDHKINHAITIVKEKFGSRLTKIFSPQHGLVGNVQDNMVESDHFIHPYFKLPVFSLYSETRSPKEEWLHDVDAIIVDLQDVGTRIYTYIYTLSLLMEKAQNCKKRVIVLDRPNPIGGVDIEGNILESEFKSFVGLHELPVRHGLTIGEFALYARDQFYPHLDLQIVPMLGWERWMNYEDTKLPWVLPSPNLATPDAAFTFVGSVIFEGTNVSEGRGTTRSLEILGHPKIEAFSFAEIAQKALKTSDLEGCALRPVTFLPTFQKHAGLDCGGVQIHVTNRKTFKSWKVSQILCREFYRLLGENFKWKQPPYEYEYKKLPIDLINGNAKLREWVEKDGSIEELNAIENHENKLEKYNVLRKAFYLY